MICISHTRIVCACLLLYVMHIDLKVCIFLEGKKKKKYSCNCFRVSEFWSRISDILSRSLLSSRWKLGGMMWFWTCVLEISKASEVAGWWCFICGLRKFFRRRWIGFEFEFFFCWARDRMDDGGVLMVVYVRLWVRFLFFAILMMFICVVKNELIIRLVIYLVIRLRLKSGWGK